MNPATNWCLSKSAVLAADFSKFYLSAFQSFSGSAFTQRSLFHPRSYAPSPVLAPSLKVLPVATWQLTSTNQTCPEIMKKTTPG
jgi:hypothetical protein